MNKKRLDYNLRYIASNVGRAQNNVNGVIKYINDEDSIVDVDELCQHTLENLRHIQRAVSIMMACNNGTMYDFKYKEGVKSGITTEIRKLSYLPASLPF